MASGECADLRQSNILLEPRRLSSPQELESRSDSDSDAKIDVSCERSETHLAWIALQASLHFGGILLQALLPQTDHRCESVTNDAFLLGSRKQSADPSYILEGTIP